MINFIKNLSIKWKILISAFLVLFFTIFISDGVFLYTIYKTLVYRNFLKNKTRVYILISDIKYPLYLNDIKFIRNELNYINKNKKFKYIAVYNKNKLILTFPRMPERSLSNSEKLPFYVKNVVYKGQKVGKVALKFNLQKELNGINNRVFWVGVRFFVIALGFIVMGILMFYIITVFLTKPLLEIKKNVDKIQNGDYKIDFKSSFNDELGSVINAINSMARSIEEYMAKINKIAKEKEEMNCMAIMGEMSSTIAHEVKNAIYIISSANGYIRNESKNKIVLELTDIINKEVIRLNKMSVGFLSFTKQRNPVLMPVNVNDIIKDSLKVLSIELSNLNINLIKKLEKELPLINSDAGLLKQVIINMIINAMNAVEKTQNKLIRIETLYRANFVNINIIDNGEMIPDENISEIFKPFFTTKNTGAGLGLPISLRIVQLHGGHINVQSCDKETIFSISLPPLTESS